MYKLSKIIEGKIIILTVTFTVIAGAFLWTKPLPIEDCFNRAWIFVDKSGNTDKRVVRVCYEIPKD